ncbi:MAG: 23S rRNA (pseudouridine(1915)-N(3))-methyltransferase RlmH [Eubacteriales bacterium]|nr:23S rRNA (pseudouridine(1915)-N(3))-methyltransferase RlmH [Eubacteriales bacterium]
MKITLICVGKIKEKYFSDAIAEYRKRLSRYAKLEILEVADEKTPEDASLAEELQIKAKEGDRILKAVKDGAYLIALAIDGKKISSEAFAEFIGKRQVGGDSHLVFVIGGSLGLDKRVLDRADVLLSFSDMTFPHQLMRVILLEQIYRGFRILHHEPYHK